MRYDYKITFEKMNRESPGFYCLYERPSGWKGLFSCWSYVDLKTSKEQIHSVIKKRSEDRKFIPVKDTLEVIRNEI